MFKKIIALLFAIVLTVGCVACGGEKDISFTLKDTVPATAHVGDELNFRDYYDREDGAKYTAYVSYTDVVTGDEIVEEKLSSMVFVCEQATIYTVKIVVTKDGKTGSASFVLEVLPDAPTITGKAMAVKYETGTTKTFDDILTASGLIVTPQLATKVTFESVKVTKATFVTTDADDISFEKEEKIASNVMQYTFSEEAKYEFSIKATNKSGSSESKLTVSTVDDETAAKVVEAVYDEEEKVVSWGAIEGATGYRVYVTTATNAEHEDITATTFSFATKAKGEYNVKIYPIYGTKIYTASVWDSKIFVGEVLTPIDIIRHNYTITWNKRPLSKSYTVTENGTETVISVIDKNEQVYAYTLKGTYNTNDKVELKLKAKFNGGLETEVSTIQFNYGTVTLQGMALSSIKTNFVNPVENIETFTIGENMKGNTFVMVEFTGKNAPNFAFRSNYAFSAVRPKGEENNDYSAYWLSGGLTFWFSHINNRTGFDVGRGICGPNGAIDLKNELMKPENGVAPGMGCFEDDKNYVVIIGYEPEQLDVSTAKTNVTLCILEKNADGTVTAIYKKTASYPSIAHQPDGGGKVVIYPHVITELKSTDITFTYYPAATNISDLLNNSTISCKDAIKEVLEIS